VKPMEWVRLASRDVDLSSKAMLVAYALAAHSRHIHGSNRANCTVAQLVERCHLSRHSAQRGLAELVDSGWIHGVKRRDPKTGRQSATDYILTVSDRSQGATQAPWDGSSQPVDNSVQGATQAPWPGATQAPWKSRFTPSQGATVAPLQGKYSRFTRDNTNSSTDDALNDTLTAIANVVDISR